MGISITLDDAIQELSTIGADPDKISGMGIRNKWELWQGSPLARWFFQYEIYHADDMSGIIMDSYDRHVNNKPIDLENQIKVYHKHWEKQYGKDHLKIMRKHVECFMLDEIRDKKIDVVLSKDKI